MDHMQEDSELAAERAEENRRRSGRDITPRPSAQDAAKAYIDRKKEARTPEAALQAIMYDLAVAGEENDWVRKWLIKKGMSDV